MIYKQYPGQGQGEGKDIVSAPSSPRKEASHSLHKIQMHTISPSVLIAMASLQQEKRMEPVAGQVLCSTEVEEGALASLLEGGTTWRM